MSKEIHRRRLLNLLGLGILVAVFGPSFAATILPALAKGSAKDPPQRAPESLEKLWRSLQPRQDIMLNGFYAIPESLVQHLANERVIIPLHIADLKKRFEKNQPIGKGQSQYMDGYLPGTIQAAKRRQDVTMVLEMPAAADMPVKVWGRYLHWLIPQLEASRVIIGNEMYHTKLTKDGKDWSQYPEYFAVAHDIIRLLHPKTEITLSAPAYFGHGETLQAQIRAIEQFNAIRVKNSQPPVIYDSIALHFYDEADKLAKFLREQRNVLQRYGRSDRPIHLTEIGVLEDEEKVPRGFNELLKAQQYLKLTAVATAAIDGGEIASAYPYTAWDPSKPHHSLFNFGNNRLTPKPAYLAYELARRLFHHEVTLEMNNNIVQVKGVTAVGQNVGMAWNAGSTEQRYNVLGGERYRFTDKLTQTWERWAVLNGVDTWGRSGDVIIAIKQPGNPPLWQ